MTQRWYHKASVQAAIGGGLFVLLAALVQPLITWYTTLPSKGLSSLTQDALDQAISNCESLNFKIDVEALNPQVPVGLNFETPNFVLKGIELHGNTVYPTDYFDSTMEEWIGRSVSAEDLHRLGKFLTALYVNAGYINSVAVIPAQDVSDGVVRIDVIEGEIPKVVPYLGPGIDLDWVRKTVQSSLPRPFNCKNVDKALNSIRDRYSNTLICIRLKDATSEGRAILRVYVGGVLNPCAEKRGRT